MENETVVTHIFAIVWKKGNIFSQGKAVWHQCLPMGGPWIQAAFPVRQMSQIKTQQKIESTWRHDPKIVARDNNDQKSNWILKRNSWWQPSHRPSCLQETWLPDDQDTAVFDITGYHIVHFWKASSECGGMITYVSDTYSFSVKNVFTNPSL